MTVATPDMHTPTTSKKQRKTPQSNERKKEIANNDAQLYLINSFSHICFGGLWSIRLHHLFGDNHPRFDISRHEPPRPTAPLPPFQIPTISTRRTISFLFFLFWRAIVSSASARDERLSISATGFGTRLRFAGLWTASGFGLGEDGDSGCGATGTGGGDLNGVSICGDAFVGGTVFFSWDDDFG
jgi:hypothetical protein